MFVQGGLKIVLVLIVVLNIIHGSPIGPQALPRVTKKDCDELRGDIQALLLCRFPAVTINVCKIDDPRKSCRACKECRIPPEILDWEGRLKRRRLPKPFWKGIRKLLRRRNRVRTYFNTSKSKNETKNTTLPPNKNTTLPPNKNAGSTRFNQILQGLPLCTLDGEGFRKILHLPDFYKVWPRKHMALFFGLFVDPFQTMPMGLIPTFVTPLIAHCDKSDIGGQEFGKTVH